jgi:hypothetical protein
MSFEDATSSPKAVTSEEEAVDDGFEEDNKSDTEGRFQILLCDLFKLF